MLRNSQIMCGVAAIVRDGAGEAIGQRGGRLPAGCGTERRIVAVIVADVDLLALCREFLALIPTASGTAQQQFGELDDRKSVVTGKSGSVRVDPGGRRQIKKKK